MVEILAYTGILMAAASGMFLATALYLGSRRNPNRHRGDLQREVGAWGERALAHATPVDLVSCLRDEVADLHTEVRILGDREPRPSAAHERAVRYVAEEAADCYLLLLHLAHRTGFDLEQAAVARHAANCDSDAGDGDPSRATRRIDRPAERSRAPIHLATGIRASGSAHLRVISTPDAMVRWEHPDRA